MVKATFSLDEQTVNALRRAAERSRRPQSAIVREAIVEYAAREERLPEGERARRLEVLRDLAARKPTRSKQAVDRELSGIRRSRKAGWARTSD
jgi:hypothetical protein